MARSIGRTVNSFRSSSKFSATRNSFGVKPQRDPDRERNALVALVLGFLPYACEHKRRAVLVVEIKCLPLPPPAIHRILQQGSNGPLPPGFARALDAEDPSWDRCVHWFGSHSSGTAVRRAPANLSLAPSSIFVRFLRMFRPFHGDAEDFGFLRPRKTWNTMTRRNQRWRCEYARIGDCDVGRQSAAGDPTPGAAGSVGSHARQAMRTFRQPAQRRV